MKKLSKYLIVIITILLVIPFDSSAQGKIEISPFGGYMFGGRIRFYEGELRISDNGNYGVAISKEIRPDVQVEFSWNQMQSNASFRPNYGYEEFARTFDVNVNYFQLGGIWEMDMKNVKPYGLFSMGATWFDSKVNDIDDAVRFSIALGGGAKIWISDIIGIRLQGRFLMPMYFNGVGVFCGIGTGGSGCSAGVGTSSTILEGDLTAGLIFRFGK
jgi:hypothetical protein